MHHPNGKPASVLEDEARFTPRDVSFGGGSEIWNKGI
jgi:hypothetical protein